MLLQIKTQPEEFLFKKKIGTHNYNIVFQMYRGFGVHITPAR